MIRKFFLFSTILTISIYAFSQAGNGVYQFLELPASSRIAALGSYNVSLRDNDINFGFENPSLLTSETNNSIGLNMSTYLADIKFGSAIFGKTLGDKNYFAVGIQYVDYGLFKYANETNDQVGDNYFTAKDMALHIMYARPISKMITVGATLKPIYSAYEVYTSFGIALDAGISYNDSAHNFSAGLVFKNMGTQLKGYYSDEGGQHIEPLPFNIQFGITKKLAYAPLRFSLTLQNMQNWDLTYQSTNQPSSTSTITKTTMAGTISTRKIEFLDMAFRHVVLAAEFVPSKNFYITVAYNDRREQELTMNGFKSAAGFSFGGGIKLYKFHVGFGTTQFQAGTASYQFSITTSLNEFRL